MAEERGTGRIIKVSGPLVVAAGLDDPRMYDLVRVGRERLMGEVIELRGDEASVQVYEETGGLGPGDPVFTTGMPLSVELGPGLTGSIYDGVQRPLNLLREETGNYITRGMEMPGLSRTAVWEFVPTVKAGDEVAEGDILGTVQESPVIEQRIMVPAGVGGKVRDIKGGSYTVTDVIATVGEGSDAAPVTMMQKWPVRRGRPFKKKLAPYAPLTTGQRVIDTFFPVAKGGTACVPGPFGSGKTVIQHQIAKWADAEIILFIGCGERGNEMTEVLIEFPELIDPYSGEPLMKRTVLIANTSNMPVAAREASVYTGITIAEYFRDMGYQVALQADSTSRWAEAMREISGRLEEMPGEEGFPAYLGTRIAAFYERAGLVQCNCSGSRVGSVTVVGSVSPPGGDLSEPVTQATLRVVKVFWGLEDKLAFRRHFPAINWLISYSLYITKISENWAELVDPSFKGLRELAMSLLQKESELEEIVRLIGVEALSSRERLVMEGARSVREDFLQQNAFDDVDTYSSLRKQFLLLRLIMTFYEEAGKAIAADVEIGDVLAIPVREEIAVAKFIAEENLDEFDVLERKVTEEIDGLIKEKAEREAEKEKGEKVPEGA
ncbi:MAG: V-type ATP synthase subunit A [Actinobacteria bacterium]|nr:V-type ATP synthase subunit A [Actinomycetota bacterium]MCG2796839.1 V-type ATP synthase subunit A [Actinomycetes bacterium]MBU4241201.1 V-type ATP synthase subunit A [Actinomycetota bacterium]MBU4301300.1 V-type ATP synthase subunit A [Actinomycetota bacterium]MBU4386338.1 V-type ATP synthase subunit A [Actinomycetota bacterium]